LQGKGSRGEPKRPGLHGLSRGGGVWDLDLDDGAYTINAIDGSGVLAAIEYRVKGGEWKNYSSAVRVRPYDVVEARATTTRATLPTCSP